MGEASHAKLIHDLGARLSSAASVVGPAAAEPRWSEFAKPAPGIVVKVAEEKDVVETVKYCVEHDIPFLAQGGAHSWSATLKKLGENGVSIELHALNKVTVEGHNLRIGGGALVSEVVDAAASAGLHITTGNCNGVGMIGSVLQGGMGRLIGRYGLGIDNIVSIDLVTAAGDFITVTETQPDPDLWWALRGAGANFGIVTSITMKAHPEVNAGKAWTGTVIYPPEKLEQVVQVISEIHFKENMMTHLYFTAPPPDFQEAVVLNLWFSGSEKDGREAWKPLLDVGPAMEMMENMPYKDVNGGADFFCVKGFRVAGYSSCLKRLDPTVCRKVWDVWSNYRTTHPGAEMSTIMFENYSMYQTRKEADDASAFPHRDTNFFGVALAWHSDEKGDAAADEYGKEVREIWMDNSGFDERKVYANFAYGDETLHEVFGANLPRLRKIKQRWDPERRFNYFFGIE